jgi:hypothetical protein
MVSSSPRNPPPPPPPHPMHEPPGCLQVLVQKLEAAASAAAEESDMLEHSLLSGELAVEKFADQYVRARALFHHRDLRVAAARECIPMPKSAAGQARR